MDTVPTPPESTKTSLRQRLRALAHERRRFGYRRLHVLLRREGFTVNHKRLFRLYREERLMVRKRGGRKRRPFPNTLSLRGGSGAGLLAHIRSNHTR